MTLDDILARGFDRSELDEDDNTISVKCSYCDALVINGVPCHERGCENQTHECEECCTQIPASQRICEDCANPVFFESADFEESEQEDD